MILKTKQLSKSFGGLKAINKVDFELPKNEIRGIIGPNGSGKSTFFNLVSGIYDSDPKINSNAKLLKNISYSEVISKNLRVMDLTAISLAKESNIPIYITNIFEENSLIRTLKEEGNYSKIH